MRSIPPADEVGLSHISPSIHPLVVFTTALAALITYNSRSEPIGGYFVELE